MCRLDCRLGMHSLTNHSIDDSFCTDRAACSCSCSQHPAAAYSQSSQHHSLLTFEMRLSPLLTCIHCCHCCFALQVCPCSSSCSIRGSGRTAHPRPYHQRLCRRSTQPNWRHGRRHGQYWRGPGPECYYAAAVLRSLRPSRNCTL